MSNKSDARQKRKEQKQSKLDKYKNSHIVETIYPNRLIKLKNEPKILKSPKIASNSGRFHKLVTWCQLKYDSEGSWSWGAPRQWTAQEFQYDILPKFNDFTQKTWGEIDRAIAGNGLKMHHEQGLDTIDKGAHKRWVNILKLEEFDTLFRFRLDGKKRVWGYIVEAHFFLVWWDKEHKIYPVSKE